MLSESLRAFANKTIVDNGSDDGTADLVARCLPEATLIRNSVNRGYGAANNQALKIIRTPYALLVNPDCMIAPQFVDKLLQAIDRFPDAAIIAPSLVRGNGAREISYRWLRKLWRPLGPEASGPCCVGFVSGAAMLLNMAVMHEIGFFDERFFLYYEDEDLCQRTFANKKQIVVVPDMELVHLSRGSVKGRHPLKSEFIRGYHHAQSKLVFEQKHASRESAARLRRKTLALAIVALIPRLLLPQPKYLARLMGRIAGIYRHRPLSWE